MFVENEKYYRISKETDSSGNVPHHQSLEHRLSEPSSALPPRAPTKERGNLSLWRWLFEDDRGLARTLRTFFAAALAAHQSASSLTRQGRRNRLGRMWANFCQHIGRVRLRGSAILTAFKGRFHPLKSLSQRATNSYAAGALAILVLFFVFLGFASGHGVAGNPDRSHNAILKESNRAEPVDQNGSTTDNGMPGGPELGPVVAERRSNLDYTFASIFNRSRPTVFVEHREDAATSGNPANTGASGAAAASQSLYASGGGGGGPSEAAPTRASAAVSVPETGASCWLLGLALALVCLTRQLLRKRA